MRKWLTCLWMLLFSVLTGYGQEDHLTPVEDATKYQGELRKYYDSIFANLYEGLSDMPVCRYAAFPAFGPEYVFSIEKSGADTKLIFRFFNQNYWYAKNRGDVKAQTISVFIDAKMENAVRGMFQRALTKVKEPEKPIIGADGVTYYFYATSFNEQLMKGEMWSPKGGSKMDKLVKMCERLIGFVNKKESNKEALIKDINALANQL